MQKVFLANFCNLLRIRHDETFLSFASIHQIYTDFVLVKFVNLIIPFYLRVHKSHFDKSTVSSWQKYFFQNIKTNCSDPLQNSQESFHQSAKSPDPYSSNKNLFLKFSSENFSAYLIKEPINITPLKLLII